MHNLLYLTKLMFGEQDLQNSLKQTENQYTVQETQQKLKVF